MRLLYRYLLFYCVKFFTADDVTQVISLRLEGLISLGVLVMGVWSLIPDLISRLRVIGSHFFHFLLLAIKHQSF